MPFLSRQARTRASAGSGEARDLEAQVAALRAALASCQALGQRWKRGLLATTAALALMLGLVLMVNKTPLQQAIVQAGLALGIAQPVDALDSAFASYQAGDGATALQLARPRAEQGDARAQLVLGLVYYYGRSVARDQSEAMKWFRRAADQGDTTAQFYLGLMYATGQGVPQNFSEGARWYRLAAEAGHPQAQFNLGVMYFNGEGVQQSNVHAHMWFNLAAARFPASDRRSRERAAKVRDVMAIKMTREEIAEAQKLAREWTTR